MNELQVLEVQMEQLVNEISELKKECDAMSDAFRKRMRFVFDSGEYDASKVDDEARELRFKIVKLSEEIEGKGWALKAMGEQHERLSKF